MSNLNLVLNESNAFFLQNQYFLFDDNENFLRRKFKIPAIRLGLFYLFICVLKLFLEKFYLKDIQHPINNPIYCFDRDLLIVS